MSKLVQVAHCQSKSGLMCHPSTHSGDWHCEEGRMRRTKKQSRQGGRGKTDKEITCEHMVLTAYEMYNYYLQLVKHIVVAKSSRQWFLFICSHVHLFRAACAATCRWNSGLLGWIITRGRNLRKFWVRLLSALPQHLLKSSSLVFSHRGFLKHLRLTFQSHCKHE